MMEASRLPALQSPENQSDRGSVQTTDPVIEDSAAFEQQLSNQMSQVDNAENVENNENNQMLVKEYLSQESSSPELIESSEALLIDNPDVSVEQVLVDSEQVQLIPMIALSTEQEAQSEVLDTALLDDQAVPSPGNVLPPVDHPVVVRAVKFQSSEIVQTKPVAITSKPIESFAQSIQPQIQQARPGQMQEPVQNMVMSQTQLEEGFNSLQGDVLLNKKQDPLPQQMQSRVGHVVASSVAASASQLQKIPQVTAMANLNAPVTSLPLESPINMNFNNPVSPSINAAVNSQAWSQGVTEQVAWMIRGNIQSAEIRLNPAHLGPMEVKLSIQDDVASLSFVTNHAQVREALDSAIPRLRDMLEQQGINLADVDVSQHSEYGQQAAEESNDNDLSLIANGEQESLNEGDDSSDITQVTVDIGVSVYA